MKPRPDAWQRLEEHAAAQLRGSFADNVLRASRGPDDATWRQLQDHAASQLRMGFADRVLRAVGMRIERPSLFGQVALSAATAAVCLVAVVFMHERSMRQEDEKNLAGWLQLAADTQDIGLSQ